MALPVPTKSLLKTSPDAAMLFASFGYTHPPAPLPPFLLIKLNQFITSYFGHARIRLAGEEKYVAGNIAKPKDFSTQVGFLHSLQQPPTLSGN